MLVLIIILLAVLYISYCHRAPLEGFLGLPMVCSKCLDDMPKHGIMNASGGLNTVSNRRPVGPYRVVPCHPFNTDPMTCWQRDDTVEGFIDSTSINAANHIVLDEFHRVAKLTTMPPLPTPGYKCVRTTCPPEYNGIKTCWNCEVPEN